MYDRQTFTLWENLTGQPVVGRMANSDSRLKILPMTLTTWKEWRSKHPDTKVLRLDDKYGDRWNFRYEPGLADRAREGVRFPVWLKSKALEEREEVYSLRVNGQPKAYRIKTLLKQDVVNDVVASTPVVLIIDPKSEAVRVYQRGTHTFSAGIIDEERRKWIVQEDALLFQNERLDRIPGHLSLWFAWYAFFPNTEVYR